MMAMYSNESSDNSPACATYSSASVNPTPKADQLNNTNAGKSQRGSAACTRCRRYRQKCIHETEKLPHDGKGSSQNKTRPIVPCQGCILAGSPEDCTFVPRGQGGTDRNFRRREAKRLAKEAIASKPRPTVNAQTAFSSRTASRCAPEASPAAPDQLKVSRQRIDSVEQPRQASTSRIPTGIVRGATPPSIPSHYDPASPTPSFPPEYNLPPVEEIIEAIRILCFSYFQLGFISEHHFIERLRHDPTSISQFLLLSILAVSARFTPSLIARFGSRFHATEHFSSRALALVPSESLAPSLESTQAFFFLATIDWGNGLGERSWMLLGIAVRMAGVLRLHREETYELGSNPSTAQILESEIARRTFWIILLHDNLCTTLNRPSSFALRDITALLPCDQWSLLHCRLPARRASLAGTAAAFLHPNSSNLPDRPLIVTMIQSTCLWGRVAKKGCDTVGLMHERPWEAESDFALIHHELVQWEKQLPPTHRWSQENLRLWKSKDEDLAYFAVNGILRLSHMVLARMYLPLLVSYLERPQNVSTHPENSSISRFWSRVAHLMSAEAYEILAQADLFFTTRALLDGFSPYMLFSVFVAGDVASYMLRWPHLCPEYADRAESMFGRSLHMLAQVMQAWPVAYRWHSTLLSIRGGTTGSSDRISTREDLHLVASLNSALDEQDGIYRNNHANVPAGSPLFSSSASSAYSRGSSVAASSRNSFSLSGPFPHSASSMQHFHASFASQANPMASTSTNPLSDSTTAHFNNLGAELTAFLEATSGTEDVENLLELPQPALSFLPPNSAPPSVPAPVSSYPPWPSDEIWQHQQHVQHY